MNNDDSREKRMTKQYGKADMIRRMMQAAVVLALCTSATAWADILKIGSKTQSVMLEGYNGRNFQFREANGRVLAVPRSSVKELKLDEPRKGEVVISGKPPSPDKMLVRGFSDGQFLLTENGKDFSVMGMRVSSIKLDPLPKSGRASESDAVLQITDAEINKLLARPGLTADQKATLEQYKAVKAKYRDFVAENSTMVATMDTLKSAERQKVLNDLRIRKVEEQPLKREMEARQSALIEAFPELLTGAAQAVPAGDGGNVEVSETITVTLPKLGDNEVMIMDTAVFKQFENLTEAQRTAIRDYDAAVAAYHAHSAMPPAGDMDAVKQNLALAQSTLFKAFPNFNFVQ